LSAAHFPLTGVTVIDLGQIYNGPYCTFLLAMAGARVIKIEPRTGENLRRRTTVGGGAVPFAMLNSNKLFATLDLKQERGRELLHEMVRRADALVENFAPGTLDRLGVGYSALREVNPRLVYASGSGYGLSGPNKHYPAMDLTVQAMAGVMSVTGFADHPPVKSGPALADFFGGVHLYAGLLTALFDRERTGQGRLVEVSMQEAVYASLASNLGLLFSARGAAGIARTGNRHGGLAESPYNVYATRDGYIAILCVGEKHWSDLLTAMGREDLREDDRFQTLALRVENMDAVDAVVTAFTRTLDKQPLFELLIRHRVPCAPVRELSEVVVDEHLHARRALEHIDHPLYGRVVLPNSPLRFDGVEPLAIEPSRELGADNHEVYGDWLGLAEADIECLERDQVI
jgi:crotonobetainyl-CoA:carnitine CoA-transferase CaiB-like acyl-CoA transferase